MTSVAHDMHLGQALVAGEILTEEQLDQALTEQEKSGQPLAEILFEDEKVNTLQVLRILAGHLNVPYCQLRHGLIDFSLLELIGEEEAERFGVIPLFKVHDTLTVAMTQPQLLPNVDRLRELTGCKIRPVLAPGPNIREYIKKASIGSSDIDSFLSSLSDSDVEVVERESVDEGEATDLDKMVEGSPIINLVNMAMLTAIRDKASDIHIEPEKNGTRIRYRIDGVLRVLMQPPPGLHAAIVSRVKVIGKMNIAEKRLPQEGRVRIVAEGRDIDLRVSSMPTLLGEKIVIRILDKANLKVRLQDLGFRDDTLNGLFHMLHQPYGLVLVTGPTGSGKTTTLYSALDLLRSPERNIITVEDPVEYQLNLINQIQVQESIGMTFARALRSILRQDPDIIMVGEIRDEETARVAVQAALTGHLVLATLHTNDAPGAVARLLDMGIEPYLLSSALNGVVAQRLTRTVCPACVSKYMPAEDVLEDAGLSEQPGQVFRKGLGCKECHNSGFRGRAGIYSVMEVTDELRRLIHRAAPSHELQDALSRQKVLTLRQEGVLLALDGKTSLEEVLSVTHSEEVCVEGEPDTQEGRSQGGDLRATNRQLQEQIELVESGFQTQISSLDANKRQLQEQIDELERYRDQLRQERNALEQRLETRGGQLEEVRQTLQETVAESTTLKSALQHQVSDLEHDNQRLQGQLADVEQDQDQWRQERAKLERRLEAQSQDLRNQQECLGQAESNTRNQVQSLEARIETLQDQLAGVERQRHDLEHTHLNLEQLLGTRNDDLRSTQEKLEQVESRLEAEVDSRKEDQTELQQQARLLEAALEERRRDLEGVTRRTDALLAEQRLRESALQTKVDELVVQTQTLQGERAQLKDRLDRQSCELQSAQDRLEESKTESQQLTSELEHRVNAQEAEIGSIDRQRQTLQRDHAEVEARLEERERELGQAHQRQSQADEEHRRREAAAQTQVTGLEAKSQQLREHVAKLDQERSDQERRLETQAAELRDAQALLEQTRAEQEQAAADAENRISDLESHNQHLTTQLRDVEQDRERLLEKTSDLEQRLETLTATHQERARTIEQITAGHERVESETRDQLQGLQSRNLQLQDEIGDLQQDRERLLENTSDLRQALETSKTAHQKSTRGMEQLRTEQEQAESDARKQVLGLQSRNQQLQDQMGDLEQHRIQLQQNCDLLEGRLKQQAAELALAGDRLEQTESDLRSQASEAVVKNRKLEEQIRGYERQRLQQERECDAAEQDHKLQAQEVVCLQEALERRMTEAEQVESELRQQIADLTAHRRPLPPTRLSEPQRPRIDPRASTWSRGPARPDVQPDVQAEPATPDVPPCHPVRRPGLSGRMARPLNESYRSTGASATPDDRPHQNSGHSHLPHEEWQERANLSRPKTAEHGLPMKGRGPQPPTVTKEPARKQRLPWHNHGCDSSIIKEPRKNLFITDP